MRNPLAGGAGSSFGEPIDESGEKFIPTFAQGAIGISLDELIEVFNLPAPNRIKIDVDGIEEQILAGAAKTLARNMLKSVSVEIDSSRKDLVHRVTEQMNDAGLLLEPKEHLSDQSGEQTQVIQNFVFTRKGVHS